IRVVSVAVSSEVLFHCQSLFSIFFSVRLNSPRRISKPPLSQIALSFQWLAAVRFAVWRLALQR
ncbi:hypothetical protein, partial [Devosia sp. Leaf64]|uniref:hypothetical protein n=1 Tax=Devosia sp. Leaf64 TaxID=1736229 RepID=UPI001AEBF5D2